MTFSWTADLDIDLAKMDAVTAWITGWGKEFFATLPENVGRGPGTQIAALFDEADPASVVQQGEDTKAVVLISGSKDAFEKAVGLRDLSIKNNMQAPRLMALPLPERALPAGALSNQSVLMELPDPVESERGWKKARLPEAVVGIIDYGINVAHDRFRSAEETRVLHAWNMDAAAIEDSPVPFGREWLASEIDGLGSSETERLRHMGLLDFTDSVPRPLAFPAAHGTHVLDLATGYGPEDDPENLRADLPIIAVNLPSSVAWESTGSFLGIFFLLGFEYMLARCRAIGDGVPLFVNFSFGLTGGPRGGAHLIERGIDALVAKHRDQGGGEVIVTLPAGNRNQARGHARPQRQQSEDLATHVLNWHLPPADPSMNSMEVWVRRDTPIPVDEVTLTVTPPGERESLAPITLRTVSNAIELRTPQDAEHPHSILLHMGEDSLPIGRVTLRRDHVTGAIALNIILAPTDPRLTGRRPAPSGTWKINVTCRAPEAEGVAVQAWVLRDDLLPGFRGTRGQSTLSDAGYRSRTSQGFPELKDRDDGSVRRAGTLNAIASGPVAPDLAMHHARVTVGGVIGATGLQRTPAPAPYSGSPLSPDGSWSEPEQIDCWAVCDRTVVRPGVLAAGTRSGTGRALNGTSVAAPQVLRHLIESGTKLSTLSETLTTFSPPQAKETADNL